MIRRMLLGAGAGRAFVAALALLVLGAAVAPRAAFAQAAPLAKAQQQYDAGRFADALTSVQAVLAGGEVTGSDAVAARELLARCQAKTGDAAGAKKTFLQILRQDPQYRLDEVRTPPDEVAVFKLALAAYEAEQATARARIPASISAFMGIGSGKNEDFGEYVAIGGGSKEFDTNPEFGLGVRFPLAPKWSLDLEMTRFRATNEDSVSGAAQSTYELTATSLAVSVVYLIHDSGKFRASVFAGGGPLLNAYAADKFLFIASIPIKVTDTKTGTYFHGGLEGEYLLHPKLSLTGRATFRSAKATGMFEGSEFTQYASGSIGDRDLDFSGYGIALGLRGYIGY